MTSIEIESELRKLRVGDSLQYREVEWTVKEYSTYQDQQNYELEEWLLQQNRGKPYYLLREVDPKNPRDFGNWYLTEKVDNPFLLTNDLPAAKVLEANLLSDMQTENEPHQALQLSNKTYYFESKTQGRSKGSQGEESRITWDYWDEAHQENLAIEAWTDSVYVYLSQVVNPQDFSSIKKRQNNIFSVSFWENPVELPKKVISVSLEILAALLCIAIGFAIIFWA